MCCCWTDTRSAFGVAPQQPCLWTRRGQTTARGPQLCNMVSLQRRLRLDWSGSKIPRSQVQTLEKWSGDQDPSPVLQHTTTLKTNTPPLLWSVGGAAAPAEKPLRAEEKVHGGET